MIDNTIEDEEFEQDDDCPAIGVQGCHCEHWYGGEECCFCGALPARLIGVELNK